MDLSERIEAFAGLGDYLKGSLKADGYANEELYLTTLEAEKLNPWFTGEFIHHALNEISRLLDKTPLEEWTGEYPPDGLHPHQSRTVGAILAGNIPLVGFHDFLSVLISGHKFRGKLSGKDDKLLPFLAGKLAELEPRLGESIEFTEGKLGSIDAMIATGSNNSFRYFDYYFSKYPHIFRKNRNGIAILDGNEAEEDLSDLAKDVFLYFGLGCRNVAKLYIKEGFKIEDLYRIMESYSQVIEHNKYANNYQYQRSVYLMNAVEYLDNGFLILRESPEISSPVGTLHYEYYRDTGELLGELKRRSDEIQCVAAGKDLIKKHGNKPGTGISLVPMGQTQYPGLSDYADNIDTLKFLSNL